ncbi:hypothetical protein [Mesorhizobium sp. CN2-181]|uniref:hypothetical protein n=1 Tax=Mesorhizobium yinganensis TaxID=3157707 RepID=UPI0032B75AD2
MDDQDLKAKADSIRERMKKNEADKLAIGHELILIKKTLGHGNFTNWVNQHLRVTMRTVQNYIKAAKQPILSTPRAKSESRSLLAKPATVTRGESVTSKAVMGPDEGHEAAASLFAWINEEWAVFADERLEGHEIVMKIDGHEFPLNSPIPKAKLVAVH